MKLEITRRRWILSNISLLTSPVSAPDIISSCFYKRGRLKVYIYAETVCCQLTKLTSYFPFSVAVCLEMTGDIASSIDSYAGIASLLVDIQSAKERVLIDWAEHGLYRGSLISLGNKYVSLTMDLVLKLSFCIFMHFYHRNLAPPASILGILRVYQRITAAQNIAWRLAKRLNVTRYSFDYLIDIYRQGKYTATAAEQTSGKQDR